MAVNKVEIYVSQVLEDLNNGLTWLKKDDLGYGSIQEKYNAKDQQIAIIRKHPKLRDAETSIIIFSIIDDTDDRNTTVSTDGQSDAGVVDNISENSETTSTTPVSISGTSDERDEFVPEEKADDEFAAFANL
jgi:hypothetical protein